MKTEGSECRGSCVSDPACSFRDLAVASEWTRAAERISQGHGCCSQCLDVVLPKAVQDQQWDCVVKLSEKCSVQQKSEVVRTLTAHGQWYGALQVMSPGVTPETVTAVLHRAVQEGEWAWIREVVKTGLCAPQQVGWLCDHASQSQQWDIVTQLVERGVHSALRNKVLPSALAHLHVLCTALLIELGVSKTCRDDGIKKQIAGGHSDFILQVVKEVQDTELRDFVLEESLKTNQWQLVSELVKEGGLSVTQLKRVCDDAVLCKQWSVALQLLRDGVRPTSYIVNKLFQDNMAESLLDLFPAGCLSDALKEALLVGSIKYGQGDLTLLLMQRESVSDAKLMDAIKYAVHFMDKTTLLKIIRASPRSRRVFKQKVVHQNWNSSPLPQKKQKLRCLNELLYGTRKQVGEEVKIPWLFETLYAGGEKDLALHVAALDTCKWFLIGQFCRRERNHFDLKQKKYKYALRKLYEKACLYRYDEFVEKLYKRRRADRPFLFRQAVRMKRYGLIATLCKHGVPQKELKFVLLWFVQADKSMEAAVSLICRNTDKDWLKQCAIRFAMGEFFRLKSYFWWKTFLDLLASCSDKTLSCQLFREAVRKCVKLDFADCFVLLCKKQFTPSARAERFTREAQEDLIFAYTAAVTGNRPHFISKVCEEKIGEQCRLSEEEFQLLIDVISKKNGWGSFPGICAGFKFKGMPWNDIPLKVLEYCVHKMLSGEAEWSCMAPTLNEWIGEKDLGHVSSKMPCMREALLRKEWRVSPTCLKQWCVDSCQDNLAFFLAMVSQDWGLVDTLVNSQTTLDVHQCMLEACAELAAENDAFSTGAAVLKLCPVTAENVETFFPYRGMEQLAAACEDQGLMDWALIVNQQNWTYILDHHTQCQNPVVLNYISGQVALNCKSSKKWDIARDLMTRCTDSKALTLVFRDAFKEGEVGAAGALSSCVDPSTVVRDEARIGDVTLLCSAVAQHSPEVSLGLLRVCIAGGLSMFERHMCFGGNPHSRDFNCPLYWALEKHHLEFIRLMLASGACSHQRLHEIRITHGAEKGSKGRHRMHWKLRRCYRHVLEAAATPWRLDHLARLAVSHSIGCQPGRAQRIQALPLPEPVRDLLRFKDVLKDTDEEENMQEDT
ncbi:hypothetical protein ACOMHN_058906 [Nucella lapillus]